MKILIVDDEDMYRHVVAESLRTEFGLTTEQADSGETAVEMLKVNKYDIVLLDYKMSGLSGLNVLQWMHEQKIDTPVIMLTAAGSEVIAVEGMKLGAYDYIRKEHLDMEHLPIIINGVHERYQFRQEKKRREQYEHEREKNMSALKASHEAVMSFGHVINTALTLISLDVEYIMHDLLPQLEEDKAKKVHTALMSLNNQYYTVAATMKSMLAISSRLYESFNPQQTVNGIPSEQAWQEGIAKVLSTPAEHEGEEG